MAQPAKAIDPVKGETEPQEKKPPLISPGDVRLNWSGDMTKQVIVKAPEEFQLSDLNERPEMWRLVQSDRSGRGIILGEDDEIVIHHGAKRIFCRVNYADTRQVIVYDIKQADKPVRNVALPQDTEYETKPVREGGFTYFRKSDGVRMSNPTYSTPEAAWQARYREQSTVRV